MRTEPERLLATPPTKFEPCICAARALCRLQAVPGTQLRTTHARAARPSANSEPQGTWHAASCARSAPHYSLRSQGTPVLLGLGVYLPPQEGRRARRVWLLPLESLRVGMLVSTVAWPSACIRAQICAGRGSGSGSELCMVLYSNFDRSIVQTFKSWTTSSVRGRGVQAGSERDIVGRGTVLRRLAVAQQSSWSSSS